MNWKEYEKRVAGQLKTRLGFSRLEINIKIKGLLSKRKRQVDIFVPTPDNKNIIVECKKYNKKLDVKSIDSFIGFLEDVGASWGIIVTTKGFTRAAINRTARSKIQLDIMTPDIFEKVASGLILCWGRFVVQCNNCGTKVVRYCSDLDFKIVETVERAMGAEWCHSAGWEDFCEKCNATWSICFEIWEYPYGDSGYLITNPSNCELLETGNFVVNRIELESEDE
ncbi:MAG: restriction endonuclease [Candidatus Omnitrophica bacterium]|nr:restriction endonuclease [Candidatus Omnitrophota bacterium]